MDWDDRRRDPVSRLTVRRLMPRMELWNYVKAIWVFESAGGLSEEELRIVVPNGSAKLMLYYKGDYEGRVCHLVVRIPEHKLFVAGISDSVAITSFDRNKAFSCICVEFYPAHAHRLLAIPQHELLWG
jgi:hypothetical protein